tara:strand:- start:205 stop:1290 length:1086 start_codon:yes stop_codon:yes gene_type:complete
MGKKNIFFLLPVFIYGGAGQSIKRIITNLNKKKYKINVICLGKCAYKKELEKKSVKIYQINKKKLILSIGEIKKILEKNEDEKKILISNIHYTNVLSLLFFRKIKNLKIIVNERTAIKELDIYFNTVDFIKKKIIKFLIFFLYKYSDSIITNSTKASLDLSRIINKKVNTIFSPSYINVPYFKKSKNNIKNIITITRLSVEKNIVILLKAVNLIKNKNFILKIVGDGNQKEILKNYVKDNRLEKKVKFIGFEKNISKHLKSSDLYVNCSFFEGFPNSVVEALCYKVPVICSKSHGGIYDILKKNKFGYLFELNEKSLSELIFKFLKSDTSFKKKTLLAQSAIRKFSLKECVRGYEKIFDKI